MRSGRFRAKSSHIRKNFTRTGSMLAGATYALVINARRFTRYSEQLQSLPCQRVLSYRLRIYELPHSPPGYF